MGKDLTNVKHTVFVCTGGTCKKAGSEENMRELRCAIKMAGLHECIHTVKSLCQGQCESAPIMFIQPDNVWYKQMDAASIDVLVSNKLARGEELLDKVLYREEWDEMKPVRVIEPKTHNAFSMQQDSFAGTVYGASVYAWEHNAYPLLKEVFRVYRPYVTLHHGAQRLQSDTFTIQYANGVAQITGDVAGESLQVVLSATKESPLFLRKVSRIKLYRYPDSDRCGLYFASSHDGVFIHAEWTTHEDLWNHLVNNYVAISG